MLGYESDFYRKSAGCRSADTLKCTLNSQSWSGVSPGMLTRLMKLIDLAMFRFIHCFADMEVSAGGLITFPVGD